MPDADPKLTPEERLREVASVLAEGVLRLKTYPCNAPKTLSESGESGLDVWRKIRPDVSRG